MRRMGALWGGGWPHRYPLHKRDEATPAHARVYCINRIFLWEMKYPGSPEVVPAISNLAAEPSPY